MRKRKLRLKQCGKKLLTLPLMICLIFQISAEPLTEPPLNLTESGMKLYSDSEVDILIGEISEAAYEAIEQAASEAARAAILANLEREAAVLRELQRWRLEAELRQQALMEAKITGRKNTFLAAAFGIFGGLALGVTGTIIIGGR